MQGNPGSNNQNQKSTLSWSQPSTPTNSTPKTAPPAVTMAPGKSAHVAAHNASHTGTYVGIFVGGLIVGALIGWAITGSNNNGPVSTTATSTTTGTSTNTSTTTGTNGVDLSGSTVGTAGGITISSPQEAGFAVTVSNVQVSEPTWVIVYEDRAGAPGNALGAALFLPQSGNNTQIGTVQLLRATLPGQNYFAGEAKDDGDKIFSLQTDTVLRNAAGNQILVQFSTR